MRNGHEVPVAYFSRKLHGNHASPNPDGTNATKPTGEVAYLVHELELLAIHDALLKWRHYLLGNEFSIFTDHHLLKFFMSQKRLSSSQARWAEFLQQFNLHINYTPGKTNVVPDALSRRTDYMNQSEISAVVVEVNDFDFSFLDELKKQCLQSSELAPEVQQLHDGHSIEKKKEKWKKKNSLLWKWVEKAQAWRIWIPQKMAEKVTQEIHTGPVVVCGGMEKTTDYIERFFTWKGITKDVKRIVAKCERCAQNKASNTTMRAMLQPLPIPDQKWTHLSMDFITDLPEALTGENAIYVVVDRFTKQAHFIPCRIAMTAKETAEMFLKEIYRLHGLPQSIVSDQDPRFISSFWQTLTERLGIKRNLSTPYHPESDGQTERTNRTIEQILRYYCVDQQHRWKDFLAQAEFAYNNAKHTTTGISPFYVNYGKHPRAEFPVDQQSDNEATNKFLERLQLIQERLKRNIAAAQQRQQLYANRARKKREFEEGDWVYLATANLNLQLLTRKLAPRFIGPIRIIEKISKTAYRLETPPYWKIHNVFYVGLLKECKKIPVGEVKLPLLTHEANEFEVENIVDDRKTSKGRMFLIKWKGYSNDENTWQSRADLANAPRILSQYCRKKGIGNEEM